MPSPVRKRSADGSDKSDVWWLRKKVPARYRAIVGRGEVWRSLGTTDLKAANVACVKLSAELERDWAARLHAAQDAGRVSSPRALTSRELSGLQRLVHEQTRDAQLANPPPRHAWGLDTGDRTDDEHLEELEYDEAKMASFLARNGFEVSEADQRRFLPLFLQARREAYRDLHRATRLDYSDSPLLAKYAPTPLPSVDFLEAFEFYCTSAGIKGGATGPTARRWRSKIIEFCEFVNHADLARMTADDGYRWVDHLVDAKGIARKSVRDVWLASLKAVASFIVERRKLASNPFLGIRVRRADTGTKESNQKGFTDSQAVLILTATLANPSHLTIAETRAARRWVPWICAYTSARVNEITSLLPSDVRQDPETAIWCFYLRPEMTKGDYMRVIPVHSHLIEQGLLNYVGEREGLSLPLFYDPRRAEGDTVAHPQWQKIAQRLAEWVVNSLGVTGVKPNHGWRHRFKSVARHANMHPEVENFITGHGGSDDPGVIQRVSMRYGDAWVKTLKKTIELYPRYEIEGLKRRPEPHRRPRRTRQIGAPGTRQASTATGHASHRDPE
ncbi:hypothetical protein RPB_0190 [Rhodopseudomonas palustris HaA2]|uniref:DUF6538 domain-containing protein n=2 Tax=Rhodopseudomonas palustris TaxID=1076 RepID=Q2J3Q9_RHOP2|nr:hypothetical protein RPB_0190 [Rhodopseudomonas palustris HaA2]